MAVRSLVKVLLAFAMTLCAWSLGAGPAAAADECAAVKVKAECGKKTACAWNGKACAAKAAAKPAAKPATAGKPAKPAGKTTAAKPVAKPASPAKKPEEKKPAVAKPAEPAPAEPPLDEEMPAGDGEAEDF